MTSCQRAYKNNGVHLKNLVVTMKKALTINSITRENIVYSQYTERILRRKRKNHPVDWSCALSGNYRKTTRSAAYHLSRKNNRRIFHALYNGIVHVLRGITRSTKNIYKFALTAPHANLSNRSVRNICGKQII